MTSYLKKIIDTAPKKKIEKGVRFLPWIEAWRELLESQNQENSENWNTDLYQKEEAYPMENMSFLPLLLYLLNPNKFRGERRRRTKKNRKRSVSQREPRKHSKLYITINTYSRFRDTTRQKVGKTRYHYIVVFLM